MKIAGRARYVLEPPFGIFNDCLVNMAATECEVDTKAIPYGRSRLRHRHITLEASVKVAW